MLIWGSGGGSNVLGELGERNCPVCEKRSTFHAVLEYTYRHIWYLFCWVTGREYYAVCGHCGNGQPLEEAEALMFPNDGIPFVRRKGWLLGVALIAAFLFLGWSGSESDKKKYAEYMEAPQVGDVYLADFSRIQESGFDSARSAYGFMALVAMDDERLVFVTGKEAWTKKKGVRTALSTVTRDDYDLDDPLVLDIDEVRALFDKRIIYEIRRRDS